MAQAKLVRSLNAFCRAAIEKLFLRAKLRCGVVNEPSDHSKRLYVTIDPRYTIPGLYDAAAREGGVIPRFGALDELRKVAASYLDAQKAQAQAAVTRVVDALLAPGRKPATSIRADLAEALGEVVKRLEPAVERIVETEAIAARNLGALEVTTKIATDQGIDDPTVYFVVVRDQYLCAECKRLHLLPDGSTPRVWHLSEVSRAYHRRGEDRPSIFGGHPHCFTGNTRLHTDLGLLTIKELFDVGGARKVVVDARIKNRRTQKNGRPGGVWFHRHAEGTRSMAASAVFDTGIRPCIKIALENGTYLEVSEDHEMWVDDDNSGQRIKASQIKVGDKIPLLSGEGMFGKDRFVDEAELMGSLLGDGCMTGAGASWNFFGDDLDYGQELMLKAARLEGRDGYAWKISPPDKKYSVERARFVSCALRTRFVNEFGISKEPRRVPSRLWGADADTVAAFLRGLYAADGHSEDRPAVVIAQNDREFLLEIQLLLSNFGVRSSIYTHGTETVSKPITYADGSVYDTQRKPCWRLVIGGWAQVDLFAKRIGMGVPRKQAALEDRIKVTAGKKNHGGWRTSRVASVEPIGDQQTYCLTEPMTNTVAANGIVTGQCRCTQVVLLPGYGFDSGGFAKFISLTHDEFARQRAITKGEAPDPIVECGCSHHHEGLVKADRVEFKSVSDNPEKWESHTRDFPREKSRYVEHVPFGEFILHWRPGSEQHPHEGANIRATDPAGRVVGCLFYGGWDGQGPAHPHLEGAVEVDPGFRRRGVATAMYRWAEQMSGKEFRPGRGHTPLAEAFWQQPDRSFGSGLKKTYREYMGEVGEDAEDLAKAEDLIKALPPMSEMTVHEPDASHLGGAGQKSIYRDATGRTYLYKPAITKDWKAQPKPFAAHVQAAASTLGRMIKPESIPVEVVQGHDGNLGTIQPLLPTKRGWFDPTTYTPQEQADVLGEHVVDQLLANHDTKHENFIRTKDGRILGVDKEQAFRFMGEPFDRLGADAMLRPDRHHSIYKDLYRGYVNGTVNVNPAHQEPYVARAEAIPDDTLRSALRPYAESRFGAGAKAEGFLESVVQRKKTLRADFARMWSELAAAKQG